MLEYELAPCEHVHTANIELSGFRIKGYQNTPGYYSNGIHPIPLPVASGMGERLENDSVIVSCSTGCTPRESLDLLTTSRETAGHTTGEPYLPRT